MSNNSRNNFTKKIEKVCIVLILILGLVAIGGTLYLNKDKIDEPSDKVIPSVDTSHELSEELDIYPSNLLLLKKVPDITLTRENGEKVSLEDYSGKTLILTFWNSWCSDCQEEFKYLNEFAKLIDTYQDVEFVLVNRLDGVKETKEQALSYLRDNGIQVETLFDEELKAYHALGLKMIPTTLIIDGEGILRVIQPKVIQDTAQMKALIEYSLYGGSYATEHFITTKLSGKDSGIHVNYINHTGTSPIGYDVLSESQGLLLEYGIITNNQQLFDKSLSYIKENMSAYPLVSWIKPDKKAGAGVNALLDDLRIYKSLVAANNLWGNYYNYLATYGEDILRYNTKENQLVDFYDFKNKKKGERFTLCYGDFAALEYLKATNEKFQLVYENTLHTVKNGYIGDNFPMYYSWYNYKKQSYEKDSLNMAEAMYTLYHLAQIGELKDETIQWLKDRIKGNGIKANYTVEGNVVEGFGYESTAIYALVVLIADEIGDDKLKSDAVIKMEKLRINMAGEDLNGSFGYVDGSNISSFDQCMPLLAYAKIESSLKDKVNKGE